MLGFLRGPTASDGSGSKETGFRSRTTHPADDVEAGAHGPPKLAEALKEAKRAQSLFGAHGRSRRKQREHWAALQLRIMRPGETVVPLAVNDCLLRGTVRELRTSDAHIRIPQNIGKWLIDEKNLAIDPDGDPAPQLLYAAKISQRFKDRIITQTPCGVGASCPFPFAFFQYVFSYYRFYAAFQIPKALMLCDQPLLWNSKQYDKRTYLYIYDNRIEANYPRVRFPWGFLGCGSWNEDQVVVHHFDRGSFGFRQVPCGTPNHCCFIWEPFGEVAGRQRCPCNGPLVDKDCKVNCGQWCCDHWVMTLCCCHYQYPGLEDAAEFSCAADVALQAYFDGVKLTKAEFGRQLELELVKRQLPPRSSYEKHTEDDKWSYSRSRSLVTVTIGLTAVFLQVVGIIFGALYLRYYLNRAIYENYITSLPTTVANAQAAAQARLDSLSS